MLSEESLEELLNWLPREALQALDMVDRGSMAIDWQRWYRTFVILEELGFIKEKQETAFNLFAHRYEFCELGLKLWKYYITRRVGTRWWHSLAFLRK